jgi:hypothetical protein
MSSSSLIFFFVVGLVLWRLLTMNNFKVIGSTPNDLEKRPRQRHLALEASTADVSDAKT